MADTMMEDAGGEPDSSLRAASLPKDDAGKKQVSQTSC